ncbi:MAG: MFS transporter, partial [Dehalococcoidia bacterium]|nr:MFS transporter [Dehalococcoidia bacterium]
EGPQRAPDGLDPQTIDSLVSQRLPGQMRDYDGMAQRSMFSLAFGITFMLSGLLRPLAGYLADRYSPKMVALSGVALLGVMLLLLPLINNLLHLYLIFSVMALGITLGTGSSMAKIVSAWFYSNRGVTLGLITGGGSIGAVILVPASSGFLVLFSSWQVAYIFLGLLLLVVILPLSFLLVRDRPQDMGLEPHGELAAPKGADGGDSDNSELVVTRDSTFGEALRTAFFWRLTFGYFV